MKSSRLRYARSSYTGTALGHGPVKRGTVQFDSLTAAATGQLSFLMRPIAQSQFSSWTEASNPVETGTVSFSKCARSSVLCVPILFSRYCTHFSYLGGAGLSRKSKALDTRESQTNTDEPLLQAIRTVYCTVAPVQCVSKLEARRTYKPGRNFCFPILTLGTVCDKKTTGGIFIAKLGRKCNLVQFHCLHEYFQLRARRRP